MSARAQRKVLNPSMGRMIRLVTPLRGRVAAMGGCREVGGRRQRDGHAAGGLNARLEPLLSLAVALLHGLLPGMHSLLPCSKAFVGRLAISAG